MTDASSPQPGAAPEPEDTADSSAQESGSSPEPIDMLAPLFREEPLPPEGAEAPPMWLWMIIFSVILFGAYYMGSYVGDFSPTPWLQQPEPSATDQVVAEAAVDGGQIYTNQCATCHQSDGQGVSGVFPPLVGSDWVTGDKGRLIRIVLHGLEGEIEVQNETYNGVMPAFGGQLDDAGIAAVLTFIRSEWDNDASEVTDDEAGRVRTATEGRSGAWTVEELENNMGIPDEPSGE